MRPRIRRTSSFHSRTARCRSLTDGWSGSRCHARRLSSSASIRPVSSTRRVEQSLPTSSSAKTAWRAPSDSYGFIHLLRRSKPVMTKLTRAASGALAALACVALTVDVSAQRGRGAAPGPQGRTGGPAAPAAALSIADDPLSGPIVTNAPFSADAVTTVTQVLSDGTRIEQTTTAKFYRDSAGRVRSEQTVLGLGALDPNSQPRTTITVTPDPNTRATYTLDPSAKTARQGGVLRYFSALTASGGGITASATP